MKCRRFALKALKKVNISELTPLYTSGLISNFLNHTGFLALLAVSANLLLCKKFPTAGLETGPLDNKANRLVQDQPVSSCAKKGAEYLKNV